MGEWTQSHLNTLLPSPFWLVHPVFVCVFVCCTVEVRYDRLEAKLQAQFSRVPRAATVQSRPCQEIWNRHRNRGYLTRLKESDGRFQIRAGKQIKSLTSDCRRTLECLPSCRQALADLSNRHCFLTTRAEHLREHTACGISLLQGDYMLENSVKVSHFWGKGLGICRWERAKPVGQMWNTGLP